VEISMKMHGLNVEMGDSRRKKMGGTAKVNEAS
jgi:hypothetical protein